MKQYLLAEKFIEKAKQNELVVLFHSGDASQEVELSNGIEATFGPWLKEVLAGATDDEALAKKIEEATKLAFFDHEPAWVGIKVANHLKKNLSDITLEEIRQHGQLCILGVDPEDQDFFKAGDREDEFVEESIFLNGDPSFEALPFGVEPGDIFSVAPYNPVDITLTGDDLIEFLQRNYPHLNFLQNKDSQHDLDTIFEKASGNLLVGVGE